MTRSLMCFVLLAAIATVGACDPTVCDDGQRYSRGLCYDLDAGVPDAGTDAAPAGASHTISTDEIVDATGQAIVRAHTAVGSEDSIP